MAADIIIGTQWGDEGKGKIVDVFSEQYGVIVRYQGGANAGHTVIAGQKKYVLHLLPSGILNPKKLNMIGNGVVLDLGEVIKEMEGLKAQGIAISPSNLIISDSAHLVLPYHKSIDAGRENKKGDKKIGTTGRGIGPAYTDKYQRSGIRVRDLFDEKLLETKIRQNLDEKNYMLKNYYNMPEIKAEEVLAELLKQKETVAPYIADTSGRVNSELDAGKNVLFEGAQGALLDIDFGTYPFVTSSNPTVGGALTGIGISHKRIGRVIGITKAYQTRVGNGPFPTLMEAGIEEETRKVGGEFGATTGRPRSCGWLDLVALKYVARLNGLTDIILTKIDVLSIFDTIKAAVKYEINGKETEFVADGEALYMAKPVYREFKGWKKDLTGMRKYGQMPKEAKDYIKFIEDFIKVKVSYVSVGPDREQILKK